jgi:ABC-type phosphate transport system substrate-binding protein
MKIKSVVLFMVLFVLSACGGAGEPQATLRIVISPAAHPVSAAVLTCAPTSEDFSVSIDSYYPGTFALADYDVFIRLGEPDENAAFAGQIATEEIVVVANSSLGLGQLTRSEAAELFSGRSGTGAIWIGPESDEARQLFTAEILLGSTVFSGASLAASPEQMLAEVSANPNAVGILSAAWTDESLQTIDLRIETPVLAISATEPTDAARDLIACLQNETGQAVLSEKYTPLAR